MEIILLLKRETAKMKYKNDRDNNGKTNYTQISNIHFRKSNPFLWIFKLDVTTKLILSCMAEINSMFVLRFDTPKKL